MFARIENNNVVEWDLFEGDVANRFPNLKWPMAMYGTKLPEGYVEVKHVDPPKSFTEKYFRAKPALIDGVWTETFTTSPKTELEIQQDTAVLAANVRGKRDELLTKTDIYVLPDRWDTYPTSLKQEWTNYRQELRDLTKQSGFPLDVTWPVNPMVFRIRPISDTI